MQIELLLFILAIIALVTKYYFVAFIIIELFRYMLLFSINISFQDIMTYLVMMSQDKIFIIYLIIICLIYLLVMWQLSRYYNAISNISCVVNDKTLSRIQKKLDNSQANVSKIYGKLEELEDGTGNISACVKILQDRLVKFYTDKNNINQRIRETKHNLAELQSSSELHSKQICTANAKIICCREHQDTLQILQDYLIDSKIE